MRCDKAAVFSHSLEKSTVNRRSLDRAFQNQPGEKMDADKTSCMFSFPLAHHTVLGKDEKKHQISGYKGGVTLHLGF